MVKILFSIIAVCLIGGCSQTSTSVNVPPPIPQGVSGYVFDAVTQAPIRGATVQLDTRLKQTTTTDTAGHFTLDNVPVGQYGVRAWAADFAEDTQYVSVDSEQFAVGMFPLATTSLTRGLALECLFSGTTNDTSPYALAASSTDAVFVADRFNNPASALQCNGSSTSISFPDAKNLDFGKGDFSVCFWVKGVITSGTILSKRSGGSQTGDPLIGFSISDGSDYQPVRFGTTYGETSASTNYLQTRDGRWHFFSYLFDRTGNISLYLDGQQNYLSMGSNTSVMAGNCNVSAPLLIGADSTGSSMNGILDDVRLYRGLLNPNQINLLFHENGW